MSESVEQNFIRKTTQLGLHLSREQVQQFAVYYKMLMEWNQKMNLTAIKSKEGVYEKHFFDSLTLVKVISFPDCHTLVDIGGGAGFPAIPLAIAFSHLQITVVDALAKRICFLEKVTKQLGLTRVSCVHQRAEDAARLPCYRDKFDIVTARAVAHLAVLNEFCLPFVRPGGKFVAMKGTDITAELHESKFSITKLNSSLLNVHSFLLSKEGGHRNLVVIEKKNKTPITYPRKAGIPAKFPLLTKF